MLASDNVLWGGSMRLVCCTTPPTLGMLHVAYPVALPGTGFSIHQGHPAASVFFVIYAHCTALLGQPGGPTMRPFCWWHQGGLPGLYGRCEYMHSEYEKDSVVADVACRVFEEASCASLNRNRKPTIPGLGFSPWPVFNS